MMKELNGLKKNCAVLFEKHLVDGTMIRKIFAQRIILTLRRAWNSEEIYHQYLYKECRFSRLLDDNVLLLNSNNM